MTSQASIVSALHATLGGYLQLFERLPTVVTRLFKQVFIILRDTVQRVALVALIVVPVLSPFVYKQL